MGGVKAAQSIAKSEFNLYRKRDLMEKTTKIHVTATDNELYIIASTAAGSAEICHIKSGYNNPVEYVVVPQSILPPGEYDLTMIGINWGTPYAFKIILTTGSATTDYGDANPALTAPVGAVWTKTAHIEV